MKPTDLATVVSGIAAILAITASIYGFYKYSFKKGKQSIRNKKEAFDNIYAPLRMELTQTSFTVCTSCKFPTLNDRFLHACDELSSRRFIRAKFKAFIKALSDKGESISVECDTYFPADRIKTIINNNPHLADNMLMDLIHQLEVMVATPWEQDEHEK